MQFQGKVVIVTGSSGGIGREIALGFAQKGARVVINGRHEASVQQVVSEIGTNHGLALGVVADVVRKDQADHLIASALNAFSRIDILVNNAGGGYNSRYVEDISEGEWEEVLANNLKSVFLCSQAVLGIMKNQQYGRIINISSQAGRALSILAGPHYASAKAGVIAYTRHLAKEVAKSGITVNAVAPGIVASGAKFSGVWESLPEDERRRIIEDIPIGRLGTNREIAAAVLFLASDEASYFVGATLDINGGRWMV